MNYDRRSVCITDSGMAIKSGSDGPPVHAYDNVLHPVVRGVQRF